MINKIFQELAKIKLIVALNCRCLMMQDKIATIQVLFNQEVRSPKESVHLTHKLITGPPAVLCATLFLLNSIALRKIEIS